MKLDEAIKVSEVQKKLSGDCETQASVTEYLVRRGKAVRTPNNGRKVYAMSKNLFYIDTYSGPSERVTDRYKKINRRTALYYKEAHDKTDWEPL